MTRIRKFYQTRLHIYQTIKDNDIYYLYELKDATRIRDGEYPWDFIRRFNNGEDLLIELMRRMSVPSDTDLHRYEIDEDSVGSKIDLYRNS